MPSSRRDAPEFHRWQRWPHGVWSCLVAWSLIAALLLATLGATLALERVRPGLASPLIGGPPGPAPASLAAPAPRVPARYGQLPLSFEANHGQVAGNVDFVAHGAGYSLLLSATGALLALPAPAPQSGRGSAQRQAARPAPMVVRWQFIGGDPRARPVGLDPLRGQVNYLVGADAHAWRQHIPTFGRVAYHAIYTGIDLVYHGRWNRPEYDIVVAPGATTRSVRVRVDGAQGTRSPRLRLDAGGALLLSGSGTTVMQHRPVAYQIVGGSRQSVGVRYILLGGNQVAFALGAYDHHRTLIIDPVVSYSTYLGGQGSDGANAVAVDHAGNVYLTGNTQSDDFPISSHVVQGRYSSGSCVDSSGVTGPCDDVFVAKLNPEGVLLYSTYLGGSSGDRGFGIAVAGYGTVYVAGQTSSINFPIKNALQPRYGGGDHDAFIAHLSADGSTLLYSTYLGGSADEKATALAVDRRGAAYVTGWTTSDDFRLSFPLQGRLSGNSDAFVAKLTPDGRHLAYSTYLGGSGADQGHGIAVDQAGAAYITGNTRSDDFPMRGQAVQSQYGGGGERLDGGDAFVAKIRPKGDALAYSTYLGGSLDDSANAIAVDGTGSASVTGWTDSEDFPLVHALQPSYGGHYDAFIARLTPSGDGLIYSTYLGGSGEENAFAIAVGGGGKTYIAGHTASSEDFPRTYDAVQPRYGGGPVDGFMAVLGPGTAGLAYSTYLGGAGDDGAGGITVDHVGNVYVAGWGNSTDLMTVHAYQANNAGSFDAFVLKMGNAPLAPVTATPRPRPAARPTRTPQPTPTPRPTSTAPPTATPPPTQTSRPTPTGTSTPTVGVSATTAPANTSLSTPTPPAVGSGVSGAPTVRATATMLPPTPSATATSSTLVVSLSLAAPPWDLTLILRLLMAMSGLLMVAWVRLR